MAEFDALARATEYCEGYSDGFHDGLTRWPEDDAHKTGWYGKGFKRGFESGRSRASESTPEKIDSDDIRSEFQRLDGDGPLSGQELESWRQLNERVKAAGYKSWENTLLELYANLRTFTRSCVTLSDGERAALEVATKTVAARFARTIIKP